MPDGSFQSAWVVVPQVRGLRETVYGVKTHYLQAGAGEPVVLIHGGGPGACAEPTWRRIMPALAEHFQVYALDLIGAGLSDRPQMQYSFQALVEHIAGFVDALNLDQVRVVGNSVGAYLAVKYALDHPARVKQAVVISSGTLANAVGLSDGGKAVALPRYDGSKEAVRRFLGTILNDPANITDDLVELRVRMAALPGHREMLDSMQVYRKLMADDSSVRQQFDVRARLPELAVPWCMIWGEGDRSAPLDPMGQGLRALVPNVPFHVVAGSGHQVQNDKPEECTRLLLQFFGAAAREPVRT